MTHKCECEVTEYVLADHFYTRGVYGVHHTLVWLCPKCKGTQQDDWVELCDDHDNSYDDREKRC